MPEEQPASASASGGPEAKKEAKKAKKLKGRHPSAMKRHRQGLKRAARNRRVRSVFRAALKEVRAAAVSKDVNLARTTLQKATSLLARAASKGVLPRRNASRHIARLSTLVARMTPTA